MPFDAELAIRLQRVVASAFAEVKGLAETRMFGGFGYLLNGNMCVGIHKDTLMIRVGNDAAEELVKEKHVRPMDLTGRVMKGWATIEPEAMRDDKSLQRFCKLAIDFVRELPPKKKDKK
ncbi:MAG: TfoX/Sxy family protein [Candidatus Hydrogenedentes bacterium]|nr:TfoX/Sxy family protein [Candidatus Hydrogenedentota bacterium]